MEKQSFERRLYFVLRESRSVAKRSGESAHGSLFFSALRCYFFRNLLRLWWLLCIILKKFCFSVENFCNTTALQLSTFCIDLKWRLSLKSCYVFLRRWRWKHILKADLLWRDKYLRLFQMLFFFTVEFLVPFWVFYFYLSHPTFICLEFLGLALEEIKRTVILGRVVISASCPTMVPLLILCQE